MVDPSRNIPKASDPSSSWIQWHKQLRKLFGKKDANNIWAYAWAKRGGVNSQANTMTLREYMSGQGVDIETTTLGSIGDTVSGVVGGFTNTFKWIGIIGLGLVGLVMIRIVWSLTKDPNKTAGAVVMATPAGRVRKATKSLKS